MKTKLSIVLSASASLLVLLGAARAWSCGTNTTGSATITNLPGSDDASFQANALSAGGQIAGQFNALGQGQIHAFYYFSGSLTDLGTLGGATSAALALSPSGLVAGQAKLAGNNQSHAFRWSSGPLLDLGTLGGSSSTPAAINDAGQVAGQSFGTGDATTVAFLYSNGAIASLGTLGGDYSCAFDLNGAGQVIGESSLGNGDIHGFLYSGGAMTDVGTLGGDYSSCFAVNGAGTVVGESSTPNNEIHGCVYSQGALVDVGTLDGTFSSAFAVNAAGQVIGIGSAVNDSEYHGFLYSEGRITDLGTLGGFFSFSESINNLGQIVGDSAIADGTSHAFLWQQGTLTDLNTLLPAGSGWVLGSARYINDSGRIVGLGTLNGVLQWFVMDLVSANTSPVALAGPDQTADCPGQFTLDGSRSYDPDGGALAYQWSAGEQVIGTNPTLTLYFATGTNIITLRVTDPCGASAQTNVVVTVADTTPPAIVKCPASLTLSTDTKCQAVVPNVLNQVVVTDNCTPTDLLKMSQSPAAGTVVGPGAYTINVTVSDASGNSASAAIPLSVADTTPPVILARPAKLTLGTDANCQAVVPNILDSIVVTDNCTPASLLTMSQSPAAGTAVGPGAYTINVTVSDASGNSASAAIPLTVADTTPPVIQAQPAKLTLGTDANCQAVVPNLLSSIVATDNCTPASLLNMSQSPAAGTVVGQGAYTINVTVSDASGNSTSTAIPLVVVDQTPPTIQSVAATPNELWPPNHKLVPVILKVTASDNCDTAPHSKIVSITCNEPTSAGEIQITGDLSARFAASRNGNARVYSIKVQCVDASGNISTATATVTVPHDRGAQ